MEYFLAFELGYFFDIYFERIGIRKTIEISTIHLHFILKACRNIHKMTSLVQNTEIHLSKEKNIM